ncbi:MAG: hypothetical protein ACI3Z0_11405 [Candidatus Cryptobacteroides sp.]
MEDINREIVNGANPSIIWSQHMDFLATYGKQMKATYTKRMRENNPFTCAELDVMNKYIHDKLDKLMTWSDNLEVESKKLLKQRITESKLKKSIGKSIRKVLNELGDTPRGQYAVSAVAGRAKARAIKASENGDKTEFWKQIDKFRDADDYRRDAAAKSGYCKNEPTNRGFS